jgi:peptidoglycan/xylan/chitin deacetylase (PgdA/CDA1 family)
VRSGPWPRRLLAVAVVVASLGAAGWGRLGEIDYKVKPIDGSLWADQHGRGGFINGRGEGHRIMFTFDDGPDHRSTPILLDHLDRYGIKAVFFINGHRMHPSRRDAPENIETLREVFRRGHVIANHTFNHRDLTTLTEEQAQNEIDGVNRLVEKVTGRRTWLFRPPFGKIGGTARYLAKNGYTTVMWSLDPLDWQTDDPREVVRRVVARLTEHPEGGIIDLHDTNLATVEAFPLVMEWIEQENAERTAHGTPTFRVVGLEAFFERGRP